MATNNKVKKQKYEFKAFDTLLGEDANDILDFINEDVKMHSYKDKILIQSIIPNPYQPRKTMNSEELEELSQSIIEHGLIQPIVVTKIDNNNYQLVAGQRRIEASKMAGLEYIDAIIVKLTDKEIEEVALIENIQRVDLSPIEEAIAYKKLMETLNITQEEIGKKVKKSRSHIANILRLLNLPENIQKDLISKKVTMGQVRPLLATLDKPELLQDYYRQIIEKDLSARQIENLVKFGSFSSGSKSKIKVNKKTNDVIFLEEQISQKLGTRVNIEKKKLIISYTNNVDLNRILEILKLID